MHSQISSAAVLAEAAEAEAEAAADQLLKAAGTDLHSALLNNSPLSMERALALGSFCQKHPAAHANIIARSNLGAAGYGFAARTKFRSKQEEEAALAGKSPKEAFAVLWPSLHGCIRNGAPLPAGHASVLSAFMDACPEMFNAIREDGIAERARLSAAPSPAPAPAAAPLSQAAAVIVPAASLPAVPRPVQPPAKPAIDPKLVRSIGRNLASFAAGMKFSTGTAVTFADNKSTPAPAPGIKQPLGEKIGTNAARFAAGIRFTNAAPAFPASAVRFGSTGSSTSAGGVRSFELAARLGLSTADFRRGVANKIYPGPSSSAGGIELYTHKAADAIIARHARPAMARA